MGKIPSIERGITQLLIEVPEVEVDTHTAMEQETVLVEQ